MAAEFTADNWMHKNLNICVQPNSSVILYLLQHRNKFPNTFLQCYFTSIEFATGEFDTSLKLYSSGCMAVILSQLQLS